MSASSSASARRWRRAGALDAGSAGLLDSDRIGAVQLDRSGRVLEANSPALAVLRARATGLRDEDGMLRASLPKDDERLRKLLGSALPDWRDEAPCGGSMNVRRTSVQSRLALHVMPIGDRASDFGGAAGSRRLR